MLALLTEKPCKKLKDTSFTSVSLGTSNRKSVQPNTVQFFSSYYLEGHYIEGETYFCDC